MNQVRTDTVTRCWQMTVWMVAYFWLMDSNPVHVRAAFHRLLGSFRIPMCFRIKPFHNHFHVLLHCAGAGQNPSYNPYLCLDLMSSQRQNKKTTNNKWKMKKSKTNLKKPKTGYKPSSEKKHFCDTVVLQVLTKSRANAGTEWKNKSRTRLMIHSL